jgi:hypothetical protein
MAKQVKRQVLFPDYVDKFMTEKIRDDTMSYTDSIKGMVCFAILHYVSVTKGYPIKNYLKKFDEVIKKIEKKNITSNEYQDFLDEELFECRKAIDYFNLH